MGDEGEKVESEFIKIVPPENGWWGVETYQISLHQTEARAIAERDEIAKWLAPILRQVERETWMKAASALETFRLDSTESFTAIAFNDACLDFRDYCRQQAKEGA